MLLKLLAGISFLVQTGVRISKVELEVGNSLFYSNLHFPEMIPLQRLKVLFYNLGSLKCLSLEKSLRLYKLTLHAPIVISVKFLFEISTRSRSEKS